MNVSSYNVTDVGYHYIGIRALAGLPERTPRDEQTRAIARSVFKYVSDKSLRLMLPAPKGTFETVGEKVCQELVHFGFAASRDGFYGLTERGREVLRLLDSVGHVELRRIMAQAHLNTYDNLRGIVFRHFQLRAVWRPIVEARRADDPAYVATLLEPTFQQDAESVAVETLQSLEHKTPKKIEDALTDQILRRTMVGLHLTVPIFRSISDRLVSLRLLNIPKVNRNGCDFLKSYSPCVGGSPPHRWYTLLLIEPKSDLPTDFYFCEPDTTTQEFKEVLLAALDEAFGIIEAPGGYHGLPEVRDHVCERLMIPEAAFDEGVEGLLRLSPSPITVGLTYEGISARRKPLVRTGPTSQIYNLIRRS